MQQDDEPTFDDIGHDDSAADDSRHYGPAPTFVGLAIGGLLMAIMFALADGMV